MLLGWTWASPDRAEGERVVEDLRRATAPDADLSQPTTWTAWQSAADSIFPKGVRAYWKNTSLGGLDDATIESVRATVPVPFEPSYDFIDVMGAPDALTVMAGVR